MNNIFNQLSVESRIMLSSTCRDRPPKMKINAITTHFKLISTLTLSFPKTRVASKKGLINLQIIDQ